MPRGRVTPKVPGYRRERTPGCTEPMPPATQPPRTHQFFRVDTGLAPRAHAWGLCFLKVKLATLHIVLNRGTNTNPLQTCSANPIPAAKPPPSDHASRLVLWECPLRKQLPSHQAWKPPSVSVSLGIRFGPDSALITQWHQLALVCRLLPTPTPTGEIRQSPK